MPRSSDQQHSEELDMSVTKTLREAGGILVVIEREEPIDQLIKTVLKTAAPLAGRPTLAPVEDAVRASVLQFNRAEDLPFKVTDDNVSREVPEDLELVGQSVGRNHVRKTGPDEGR